MEALSELNGKMVGLGKYYTKDLNTATETGYWALNKDLYHNANFPDMAYGGLIVYAVNNNSWIYQKAFTFSGNTFIRARNEHNEWSNWKRNT